MILFLNKKDLFAEKIQRVNITTAFPDYEGSLFSFLRNYKALSRKYPSTAFGSIILHKTSIFLHYLLDPQSTSSSFLEKNLSINRSQSKFLEATKVLIPFII